MTLYNSILYRIIICKYLRIYWNSSSEDNRRVFSLFVTLACLGWMADLMPVEAAEAAFEATEAAVVATARAATVAELAAVSSAHDSPKDSSFLRRLPAAKRQKSALQPRYSHVQSQLNWGWNWEVTWS